jgi:polyhydroxybutyrate depolymerase
MKIRKIVIGAVLVILGLLAVLVAVLATAVYVLNKTNGTLLSSGRTRESLLYVPKSYERAKPTPLVISMHAAAMWPAHQMNTSRWNRLADEQGFIVIYPAGGFGTLARA